MILRLNSEGAEVANWQKFLISQGFSVEADGDYGAKTEHATKQWQLSVGLIADGEVGENSFAAAAKIPNVLTQSQKPPAVLPIVNTDNAKLQKVHPVLAKRAAQLISFAKADGYELIVTQGLRTFAEQDALFAKRPKVTGARGGQSMHNYGLAVDFAFVVNGKISWDEKLYSKIGQWADLANLEWGGRWKFVDKPHVQLRGLPSYKKLLPMYRADGLSGIWQTYQG